MSASLNNGTCRLIIGYLASVLLVPVYVSMFSVWKVLSSNWEKKLLYPLPIIVTLGFLIFLFYHYHRRIKEKLIPEKTGTILWGIGLCLFALAVPDPAFPVKRIHVAEYMLLSLVVRFAMSHRLQGAHLLFFSACFTALLGIHDEFLQGLHPSRTYGLRDITVNFLGGWGGALIWHGLGLFLRPVHPRFSPGRHGTVTGFLFTACLLFSVAALAFPAAFFRGSILPIWTVLPLVGMTVFYSLYENEFPAPWKHGITALSCISLPAMLYPVITHAGPFLFY